MEKFGSKILLNQVPDSWTEEQGCGYLSIKPLANWIIDLKERIKFFKDWEAKGTPKC